MRAATWSAPTGTDVRAPKETDALHPMPAESAPERTRSPATGPPGRPTPVGLGRRRPQTTAVADSRDGRAGGHPSGRPASAGGAESVKTPCSTTAGPRARCPGASSCPQPIRGRWWVTVNGTGLRWWRNGSFAGQDAPHSVPRNHQIHGTMKPVHAKNRIEYQEYVIWRHDIGPGGTASLTFAGRLDLTNQDNARVRRRNPQAGPTAPRPLGPVRSVLARH